MENKTVEFDKFADEYNEIIVNNMGAFGKYRDTAYTYKINELKHLFKNEPKYILDFGCGIGSFIPYLHNCFPEAKIYGCDISSESIEKAKRNYPYCDFKTIEKVDDLYVYKQIDCIIINTVLHHIPLREHEYWINGLHRLLNKNNRGIIIIFEHNMKNPLTRFLVKRSKMDEDSIMLSSRYCKRLLMNRFYTTKMHNQEILLNNNTVKLKYTYFSPWRNTFVTIIERFLFWLPLGAQYCVYAKLCSRTGENDE